MGQAPWRATCIQMRSDQVTRAPDRKAAWGIVERNLRRAVGAIDSLFAGRADDTPKAVVLPEFAFQGPPHGEDVAAWIEKACHPLPGDISTPLQDRARAHGIYIAANQFEADPRWPGRFFNCSFLIDPHGDVVIRYRRISTALWPSPHDVMDEYLAEYGVEGTFPVVETELGRLAVMPCGEIAVPEIARVFMLRGAEVLLHPTNEAESPGQEAAKVARAAENMMYVVSTNVAGPIGFSLDGAVTGGRSQIIDYRGEMLARETAPDETTAVSAMIDVGALRAARREKGLANTLLRSRFEMYEPALAGASFYPPNSFHDRPMADTAALDPVVEAALANMAKAGVLG